MAQAVPEVGRPPSLVLLPAVMCPWTGLSRALYTDTVQSGARGPHEMRREGREPAVEVLPTCTLSALA